VQGLCALEAGTVVVRRLGDSPAPEPGADGGLTMPPGARYVLRVSTAQPVGASLGQGDMGLYVLDPRFTERALSLPFKEKAETGR
jgi:hypothetical protein